MPVRETRHECLPDREPGVQDGGPSKTCSAEPAEHRGEAHAVAPAAL
jgi:hypothetical protein